MRNGKKIEGRVRTLRASEMRAARGGTSLIPPPANDSAGTNPVDGHLNGLCTSEDARGFLTSLCL